MWKKLNRTEEWIGGYEYVKEGGKWVRKFTLERIPVRGSIKKKTLYFSSPKAAEKKKWIKVK